MTATATKDPTHLTAPCGFCKAGLHHLCPDAVWNPRTKTALYCPCGDPSHEGVTARCRNCGDRPLPGGLSPELTCVDSMDCELRVAARLESDPIHQLLQECQTTRIVAGEVVARPRREPRDPSKPRAATTRRPSVARDCVCGCGGMTKGGSFLPGHDSRYVSMWVQRVADQGGVGAARDALAPFPALLAKFEKRIGS